MKKLLVLLTISLMATSAFAQVDTDPDMIGVYFDTGATSNSAVIAPATATQVYVIITNPTSAQVQGLEVGYEIVAPAGSYFRLQNSLPGGAVDLGNSDDITSGDYVVGLAAPMPSSSAVVFITWSFFLTAPVQMDIYLGPSAVESIPDGLPAYETGGTIQSLGLSTGGVGTPCAVVNGTAPVAVEETSFGGVKSLFR